MGPATADVACFWSSFQPKFPHKFRRQYFTSTPPHGKKKKLNFLWIFWAFFDTFTRTAFPWFIIQFFNLSPSLKNVCFGWLKEKARIDRSFVYMFAMKFYFISFLTCYLILNLHEKAKRCLMFQLSFHGILSGSHQKKNRIHCQNDTLEKM